LSDALPIAAISQGASARDPRAAIARAAQATGVDFGYLLAEAKLESSMDPSARATRSSAAGLFQFTDGTWASTLARHGAEHGLDWAQDALSAGGAGHAQAMALRYDPDASAMMAAELARENGSQLTAMLGRAPEGSELYLAHFLGIGGAKRFLSALSDNPATSAASLLPEAAAANPSTFYTADGTPRTVAETMALLRTRMASATETGATGSIAATNVEGELPLDTIPAVSTTQSYAQLPAATTAPRMPPAPRMSEILDSALGAGESGAGQAPGFVRTAYAKLQAFGL
jgi:Transglycosylase SLT domain